MFDLIKKNDGIWLWENAIEDPESFFSNILNQSWESFTNVAESGKGGSTIIGRNSVIEEDSIMYDKILKIFTKGLNEYDLKENSITDKNMNSGYWLVREYNSGSYMEEHSDVYSYVLDKSGNNVIPKLTAIIYINDDYIGGEITFPHNNVSIKPKAGTLIIFPSNLQHRVDLISEGNRYMTQTYIYDLPYSEYDHSKWASKK
jgi:predicted 2-oxoglutarate/Fe(II)-dependent dioxygenase YbiX